ncbi:hypothetical protein SAY86_009580 [Trapa natans]|uniref:Uncharacterized protein n=1 Tax=Trapa natans TaxID=22666 RepID=A0AAN7KX39_TRANT|nr:hypothetical protein SAY86_009580 [Trapa natans]
MDSISQDVFKSSQEQPKTVSSYFDWKQINVIDFYSCLTRVTIKSTCLTHPTLLQNVHWILQEAQNYEKLRGDRASTKSNGEEQKPQLNVPSYDAKLRLRPPDFLGVQDLKCPGWLKYF